MRHCYLIQTLGKNVTFSKIYLANLKTMHIGSSTWLLGNWGIKSRGRKCGKRTGVEKNPPPPISSGGGGGSVTV